MTSPYGPDMAHMGDSRRPPVKTSQTICRSVAGWGYFGRMTTDPQSGGELTDDTLQGEIELVGDLVVAASASERPLTEEEIDLVLGVERAAKRA